MGALVGMVASIPLEKGEGETNLNNINRTWKFRYDKEGQGASTPLEKGEEETNLNDRDWSFHYDSDLKEGQGVGNECKFAGIVADSSICRITCKKYGYPYMQFCSGSNRCWCGRDSGSCPC